MRKFTNKSQRAQNLVEFALILPVFVFLVVVIFDFGRAVYYYNALHNAAREGARYGAIHPSTSDYGAIKARAIEYAVGLGLTDDDVNVLPGTPENVGNVINPTIKVIVSYDFTPVTPFVAEFMPCGCNYLTLTSAATMRTEALP